MSHLASACSRPETQRGWGRRQQWHQYGPCSEWCWLATNEAYVGFDVVAVDDGVVVAAGGVVVLCLKT